MEGHGRLFNVSASATGTAGLRGGAYTTECDPARPPIQEVPGMFSLMLALAVGADPAPWDRDEAAHLTNVRQLTADFVRAGEGLGKKPRRSFCQYGTAPRSSITSNRRAKDGKPAWMTLSRSGWPRTAATRWRQAVRLDDLACQSSDFGSQP